MYANHASFCLDTPYFITIIHACNQKVSSVHYTSGCSLKRRTKRLCLERVHCYLYSYVLNIKVALFN